MPLEKLPFLAEMAENKDVSSEIESDIRQLYIESGDPALVASQLVKRWDANVLSENDIRSISRFMIHTGLLPHLLNQIRRSLKKDAQIPWSAFIETLAAWIQNCNHWRLMPSLKASQLNPPCFKLI